MLLKCCSYWLQMDTQKLGEQSETRPFLPCLRSLLEVAILMIRPSKKLVQNINANVRKPSLQSWQLHMHRGVVPYLPDQAFVVEGILGIVRGSEHVLGCLRLRDHQEAGGWPCKHCSSLTNQAPSC